MSTFPVIKMGLIGLGKIGRRHLKSYSGIPDVSLVAYDVDEAAMRALDVPGLKKCANEDELFSTPGLEAVDVCTPTSNHETSILRALRGSLHVLCEKPLAPDASAAARVAEARREAGRVLMVAYPFRFSPQCRLVKQLVDDGAVGRPYLAFFRVAGPGSHAEWKHARADGGARLEKLVHLLDLAAWYFGAAGTVEILREAMIFPRRRIKGQIVNSTVEDVVMAYWSGPGVEAYLQADLVSSVYAHNIEIQGTNGCILASVVADSPVVLTCIQSVDRFPAGRSVFSMKPTDFHNDQLLHFLRLIRSETLTGHHTAEDSVALHKSLSEARRRENRTDGPAEIGISVPDERIF